jgi:outer membrane protein TolC
LQAEHRRLLLDIELEVRRSNLQLNDAQARLKVADETVGQAQESLREIEVRYQGQTATITELVDAQVALSNARVRRTNAQADVEIARVALQRALGRLTGLL